MYGQSVIRSGMESSRIAMILYGEDKLFLCQLSARVQTQPYGPAHLHLVGR